MPTLLFPRRREGDGLKIEIEGGKMGRSESGNG